MKENLLNSFKEENGELTPEKAVKSDVQLQELLQFFKEKGFSEKQTLEFGLSAIGNTGSGSKLELTRRTVSQLIFYYRRYKLLKDHAGIKLGENR